MCEQDEPIARAIYDGRNVVSSFYEVLDELAKTISVESKIDRRAGGPPLVSVLLGNDIRAVDSDGTYVDREGGGHVAIRGSTPWAVLHELAHRLTSGQSARRWLDTNRDLVRERYGDWDAALFDYGAVRRIAYDEYIKG